MNTLRELLAAATPGPWEFRHGSLYPPKPQPGAEPFGVNEDGTVGAIGIWPILSGENTAADAALIVALRSALPALLDVLDAARDLDDPMVRAAGGDRWWAAHDRLSEAVEAADDAMGSAR